MSENSGVGFVVPSTSEGAALLKCSVGDGGLVVGSNVISAPEVLPIFSLINGECRGECSRVCSQIPLVRLLRFALILT
ncbi:hypothetical protein PanWU01x14_157470 [Parasponia andersonii]|uniref:Uncharacterized protein n=1 Tax=Parasponia andersonii TaxID=3476 RepID=A0A2P5CF49_PARAD|nr:hypothetical protein PanWU01x14_157470 [Parasponia andersonii]